MAYDVGIVGGGVGGCAGAMALCSRGFRVFMSEPTMWIGGQLTSQMVPPDEHPWIEEFGCTARYRAFRDRVREQSGGVLNPGGGWVSRICHDPRVGLAVLEEMLAPYVATGLLTIAREHELRAVRDQICEFDNPVRRLEVGARMWLDASETGELIDLAGQEWVIGAESRADTGEPHALEGAAEPEAIQGITWCAAVGWDERADHTIEKPPGYERWASFEPPNWTGRLFSLTFPNVRTGEPQTLPAMGEFSWFTYRQMIREPEPVTCLNWPQNDQMVTPWPGSPVALDEAREITLSLIYWLQMECGLRGLRLRPDVAGSADGLALAPYVRESRRIVGMARLSELEVGSGCNPGLAKMREIEDSCGVGAYRIDLHPRANGRPTVDIDALPFQIPLGCLVPRSGSVVAAGKGLSVTHVANGCTRLHPVEWNVGEAAGVLASYCLDWGVSPQEAAASGVKEIQRRLEDDGVELGWPDGVHAL